MSDPHSSADPSRRRLLGAFGAAGLAGMLPSARASTARPLGVALIGLGYYSRDLLAPALQMTKHCRLAGIVTGSPAKAEEWQRRYAIPDLPQTGTFTYDGEGWGLCDDGSRLIMSDGSDQLFFRDRTTFEVIGSVQVQDASGPVTALNELECVDGQVYANVYQTDTIVRIDPTTGEVTATIDASSIHPVGDNVGVMNGIAYDADSGRFLLTGKNWPSLFEVRLVPE